MASILMKARHFSVLFRFLQQILIKIQKLKFSIISCHHKIFHKILSYLKAGHHLKIKLKRKIQFLFKKNQKIR